MIQAWAKYNAPWLILIAVFFIYGYSCGRKSIDPRPPYVGQVNSTDLSRFDLPPRTFRPPPRLVITDRTVVETRIDTVRVPIAYERFRLIPDNYLTVSRGSVWVRSFNADTGMFETDRFRLNPYPRELRTSIYAETRYLVGIGTEYGLGFSARYGRITGIVGANYIDGFGAVVGIRVDI